MYILVLRVGSAQAGDLPQNGNAQATRKPKIASHQHHKQKSKANIRRPKTQSATWNHRGRQTGLNPKGLTKAKQWHPRIRLTTKTQNRTIRNPKSDDYTVSVLLARAVSGRGGRGRWISDPRCPSNRNRIAISSRSNGIPGFA